MRREMLKDLRAATSPKGKGKNTSRSQESTPESPPRSAAGGGSPSRAGSRGAQTPTREQPDGQAGPSASPDEDEEASELSSIAAEEELVIDNSQIDMSECATRILEGLRGDAFQIARDIGLDRLKLHDGIEHLIEMIRRRVFPLQNEEASDLFRIGQQRDGPLAKHAQEAMLSYVSHR